MATFRMHYGDLEISFKCGMCGKEFCYVQKMQSKISDFYGNKFGPGILQQNYRDTLHRLDSKLSDIIRTYSGIGIKKCPSCGHYQSWMLDSRREKNISIISNIATIIIFPICLLLLIRLKMRVDLLIIINGVALLAFNKMMNYILRSCYKGVPKDKVPPSKPPVLRWKEINKLSEGGWPL